MQKRKGFTLVELVIVIAVIAILAGVLIGTFASVINRANASAEVQKTKSEEIAQKAEDILKKIEDSNWYGWEDFETSIVAKITQEIKNNGAGLDADQVKKIINDALTTLQANLSEKNTQLTEDQVKAIVENAVGTLHYEGVTEAQVRAIVTANGSNLANQLITPVQIKQIVTAANANNLTAAQVASVVTSASNTTVDQILSALNSSVEGLATSVEVEKLRDEIKGLAVSETDDVVVAKALNIKLKKSGLTTATAVHPTVVFETIQVTPTLKMGASAENDIMWDSANNSFVVVKLSDDKYVYSENAATETTVGDKYKLWKVVDSIDSACLYSQYLLVTTTSKPINVVAGLDVGKNTGITAINYTRTTGDAQTVVIRTNSANTTLTIDDESTGSIYHYGSAGALNIIQCHTDSYHENGNVAFAEITTGHIVLEEGSKINHIHVNANENANGFEEVKITDNGAEALPTAITRDQVDVSEAKPVVTVVSNGTSETVYVYPYTDAQEAKTGTTEQTTTQNTAIATDLGKLVLDNGSDAGEKAMSNNEKTEAKTKLVGDAVVSETHENQSTCEHNFKDGVCSICGFIKFVGAKVGDTRYDSVDDAIDAAIENASTVVIGDDCILSFNVNYAHTINKNQSLTIDINGKNIKIYSLMQSATSAFIFNNGGTLTLIDSTADSSGVGTGKVSMIISDPDLQGIPGYASNFIRNFGEVNILSGWYHNEGSGSAAYVVDNDAENVEWQSWASAGTDVKLNVLGGKLTSNQSVSVRMYLDNDSAQKNTNTISISNATIGSLWIQDTNAKAAAGNLSIKDSTITKNLYLGWYGKAQNVQISLSNSTIIGFEYDFDSSLSGNTLNISKCVFDGSFYSASPLKIIDSKSGPFSVNVSTYCVDGLFSKEVEGKYVIRPVSEATEEDYEAFIGSKGYWTLSEAINDSNGNTVRLTKDYTGYLYFNDGGSYSLDLNGRNITDPHGSSNSDAVNVYNNTTLVITDSSNGTKGTISSADGHAIWTGSSATDTSSITINDGIKLVGNTNCIQASAGITTITINDAVTEGGFDINEVSTLTDNR